MINQFTRTELLLGKDSINKLNKSKVAIFGVGGVGSYVVEGLARVGIQNFILVDNDTVSLTNINRQLVATHSTIGEPKVDIAKKRILDINPNAKVEILQEFYSPDNNSMIDNSIDYIVDAIDNVTGKINLVVKANEYNIPIISCMGTGNKLNPTMLEVTDISKTSVCPLAKVMRKKLKSRGIKKLKVVYSKEEPIKPNQELMQECVEEEKKEKDPISKKTIPGSCSFVPSVAGLIICSEVVKDLIKEGK